MPAIGRHSVILRPDSVRRVTPPTTITAKTRAEEAKSQMATEGGVSFGRASAFAESDASLAANVSALRTPEAFEEKKRGSNERRVEVTAPDNDLHWLRMVDRILLWPLRANLQAENADNLWLWRSGRAWTEGLCTLRRNSCLCGFSAEHLAQSDGSMPE